MKYKLDCIEDRGLKTSTDHLITSFVSKLQLKTYEELMINRFLHAFKYDISVSMNTTDYYAICMPFGSTELLAVSVIEITSAYIEVKSIAYSDFSCVSIFLSEMASYLIEYREVPIILNCDDHKLVEVIKNLKTTIKGKRIPIFETRVCDKHSACIEETNIHWCNEWGNIFFCDISVKDNVFVIDETIKQEKY